MIKQEIEIEIYEYVMNDLLVGIGLAFNNKVPTYKFRKILNLFEEEVISYILQFSSLRLMDAYSLGRRFTTVQDINTEKIVEKRVIGDRRKV